MRSPLRALALAMGQHLDAASRHVEGRESDQKLPELNTLFRVAEQRIPNSQGRADAKPAALSHLAAQLEIYRALPPHVQDITNLARSIPSATLTMRAAA